MTWIRIRSPWLKRTVQTRRGKVNVVDGVDLSLGRIVETGPKAEFYNQPLHPYAQALLWAAPRPDPFSKNTQTLLGGDVPSPIHPPSGCAFHPRCPQCRDHCRQQAPQLAQKSSNRWVACWEV